MKMTSVQLASLLASFGLVTTDDVLAIMVLKATIVVFVAPDISQTLPCVWEGCSWAGKEGGSNCMFQAHIHMDMSA